MNKLVTSTGAILTDPLDIRALEGGRLTIIDVQGGVAYVRESPPKDRVVIRDFDNCGQPGFQAEWCEED